MSLWQFLREKIACDRIELGRVNVLLAFSAINGQIAKPIGIELSK